MILVLGVGNEMMGDDAFGPLVIKELRKLHLKNVELVATNSPENVTGKFSSLEKLIVLDTAELNEAPGVVKMIEPNSIISKSISTHKIPLSLIIRELNPKKTVFICAQPKSLRFGSQPSREILKAVEKTVKIVKELIK